MATAPISFVKIEKNAMLDLVRKGYERRTTVSEPRLSEIVAEYRRIGYEVVVIEHEAEPASCDVCYEAGTEAGQVYGDVYVRRAGAGH